MRAAGMALNVLIRLALMPGGGSKVKILPALRRLTGSLGVMSQVRNSRKPECAWMECSFFSREVSHVGARCTFFSRTHLFKK